MMNTPLHYMSLALELAERGRLTVSPNPMVGCVIVKNGQIIGQGWHKIPGQAHAEVYALAEAGIAAKGATVYVSLEPCCHFGRTPPCTEALIQAGVSAVYVACLDPNPLVAGKGVQALLQAGIAVTVGLHEAETRALNKIFFHYIQTKRPYVISKWAMSLDGKTITHPEDEPAISSMASLRHSHGARQAVDAIVVGARTAIHDNPQLTVRHIETVKHPLRFVIAGQTPLPLDLRLFAGNLPAKTLIAAPKNLNPDWLEAARNQGIEIWECEHQDGKIHLQDLLQQMGAAGISSLLVEGGQSLHASFFQEQLVNQIQVYLAPKIIGQLASKLHLPSLSLQTLGEDVFFETSLETQYLKSIEMDSTS